MSVRVRYAPSPTGLQHIGGVRTALFNYLFARSQGGTFILRIEDTDRERFRQDALEDLFDTMDWLGLSWDEGPITGGSCEPYVQSQRIDLYTEYAGKLVETGNAYPCYCTPERLSALRAQQEQNKSAFVGYDRHCRDLDPTDAPGGVKPVIRLKVPLDGETAFTDLLMGTITRANRDISPDPVLLKSDGFPTYHLANVVDDHLMGITHILRAQEWIPSGPLHVLLYRAFGWEAPKYCHLPMVMGHDGQKLSKRHGSTSVQEFREQGYVPEAMVNYISLLGWSWDGEREFFTREELEKLFTLEKINKAPGVFDYKKLEWFNGHYIRQKSTKELKDLIIPFLERDGVIASPPSPEEQEMVDRMIPIVRERLHLLKDVSDMTRFLFQDVALPPVSEIIPKKCDAAVTADILAHAAALLEDMDTADDEVLEFRFRAKADELGVKLGAMLMPVRSAVTGSKVSPPLFESLRLLGKQRVLLRMQRALDVMTSEARK